MDKGAYFIAKDEITLIAILGQVPGDWLVREVSTRNGADGCRYARADCVLARGFLYGRFYAMPEQVDQWEVFCNDNQFAEEPCYCEGSDHRCNQEHP
jgi:hypothetical protein